MPRKPDQVSKRLAYWIKHWPELRPLHRRHPELRNYAINHAASVFGLDPNEPTDLYLLLGVLAEILLPDPNRTSALVKGHVPRSPISPNDWEVLKHAYEIMDRTGLLFAKVLPAKVLSEAIRWAVAKGLLSGNGERTTHPKRLRRAHAYLWRNTLGHGRGP